MKFRYYITNLVEGDITGTNNLDVAKNCAESEDYFVVDTEDGKWLQPDGELSEVVDSEKAL